MKNKLIIGVFLTASLLVTNSGCQKEEIKPQNNVANPVASVSRNSSSQKIITEFLASEQHRSFEKQHFGQLDIKTAIVSETSVPTLKVITFRIIQEGTNVAKLYVYYRPNQLVESAKFIGVVESFLSSNGKSLQDQIKGNDISGVFKYQTVKAEIIETITTLQSKIISMEDGNTPTPSGLKPFSYEKWGNCIKATWNSMGPISKAICLAGWDLCFAGIATDCLIEQGFE